MSAEISQAINAGWITAKCPNSIVEFLHILSSVLPPELAMQQGFCNVTHSLLGTEIEGAEISLGLLSRCGTRVPPHNIADAAINISLLREWGKAGISRDDFTTYHLSSLRKIVGAFRKSILGWAPGLYGHPVVVFNANGHEWSLKGAEILTLGDGDHPVDVDNAYRRITRGEGGEEGGCLGVWLKPYSTMRIYYGGGLLAQVLRLRDSNLWGLRSFPHLAHFLTNNKFIHWNGTRPTIFTSPLINQILMAFLVLTEEKRGAALHVFDRGAFEGRQGGKHSLLEKVVSDKTHCLNWQSNINNLSLGEMVTYLSRDGAMVIDTEGYIYGAGVYFSVAGGRKKSAQEIANAYGGHVLVASQDGGLYFYSKKLAPNYRTPRENAGNGREAYARLDFLPIDGDEFRLGTNEALNLMGSQTR